MADVSNNGAASVVSQNGMWTFTQNKIPKEFITFICQMIILLIVIIFSLVNISRNIEVEFSRNLLCFCIAGLLPGPKIKKDKSQ